MRNLYLVATIATIFLGACTTDSGISIKCTINGETKEFVTAPGREDCEKIRVALASTTAPIAPTTPVTPLTSPEPVVVTPIVLNVPGFLEPTNKIQRQDELSAKLSSVERDPFVTIPGSIPTPTAPPAPKFTPRRVSNTVKVTPVPIAPIQPVEPPSTTEASAVLVSGILDIGGSRYAIINAPGEPTSRPVSLGQTFAGGKVLFKRIDSISGAAFVILEQNGVEVPRPIGKQPIAEAPKPANNLTLQTKN